MIDAAAIIHFNIPVGIKMHERQGAMLLEMGLEDRIGHIVIAAEGHHFGAGADDFCGMPFERVGEIFLAPPVKKQSP